MIAGDSRRLVQLKLFFTVDMISGEFFKVPIPMLFLTGLSYVESQLNKLYSKFLQHVVMLQDYHQIHYLK